MSDLMVSEATLRINELARQMRRWKMSDLIERLRSDEWASNATLRREAADEIERLRAALAESCDENRTVVLEEGPFSTDMCPLAGRQQAEIEQLQAVVDAARHLLADGDKLIWHEPVYHLEKALAALEDDDE